MFVIAVPAAFYQFTCVSDRGEHSGGGQLIALLGPPFKGSAKFSVKVDEIYSHFSALISLWKTNSDLELASIPTKN